MTTSIVSGGRSTVAIQDTDTQPWLLIERSGRPMATDVSVQIATEPARRAEAETAADACMAWFHEVDARLSRFRPDSELSRLNAAAGQWVAVSEMLYDCAEQAIASATATGGLFDPTLLGRLCAIGYDRDFDAIAQREVSLSSRSSVAPGHPANALPATAAWRGIVLDSARRRVRLPAGAQLDFGGIAKGWAADIALARYCGSFPGALVNVGGDLRAHGGPQPGRLWSVGIRDPRLELADLHDRQDRLDPLGAQTHLATISLSRGALATSGAVRRWWLRDGQRQHHLLDPRTGQPADLWINGDDDSGATSLVATATAFAPAAARAEVAAKVALLRGYPLALAAVGSAWERYGALGPADDMDAGVALALVFGSGEVVMSNNLTDYLASWGTTGAALPLVVRPAHPYLSLSDFRRLEQFS